MLGISALTGATDAKGVDNNQSIQQVQNAVSIPALLKALETVESNGRPDVVGDNGNAKGILQIWNSVIQDVNRVYKTKYVHDDAFKPDKARDIARKYLHYYGYRYSRNTGNPPTYEVLARIWNGGPKGYKKNSTLKYWDKVQKELK
jgi:hypothetical protein